VARGGDRPRPHRGGACAQRGRGGVDARAPVGLAPGRRHDAGAPHPGSHARPAPHVPDGGAVRRAPLEVGAMSGTLHIVSTPIGNLGDLSERAIRTLAGVDAILAEDTRHSRILLERYQIKTPLLAYHEHNEAKSTPTLVARLEEGESFALISD